jgi:hypothetical protein
LEILEKAGNSFCKTGKKLNADLENNWAGLLGRKPFKYEHGKLSKETIQLKELTGNNALPKHPCTNL